MLRVPPTLGSVRFQHFDNGVNVQEDFLWSICISLNICDTSLIAQLVKNPPAMRETWVQFLGWEDPLEKVKAAHFSILAWRIPWAVQSRGSQRVRHD